MPTWSWQCMGKSCRWVVPSALYQPTTCALYILHLHNPSIVLQTLYNAAIAYSAQPPPTVEKIEGAKKEILKLQNSAHCTHSPERVSRWQKGKVCRDIECTNTDIESYLILESSLPQQPPSDGYIIMLWIKNSHLTLLSQSKLIRYAAALS